MPDQPIDQRAPVAALAPSIVVQLHAETVAQVRAVDLRRDGDQLVSLKLGDDRCGFSLLGDLNVVRRLVAQPGVELAHIAHGDAGR